MKAIILAAGVGSRLGAPGPKSLLRLPSGESILGRQVRIFKSEGIKHITIVVGFKKEDVFRAVEGANFCFNADFNKTNTSKSLLLALKTFNDDIIWTNGDIVFDAEIIKELKFLKHNTVVVNDSECGEEEIKYRLDSNNNIAEISKTVTDPLGEALGINMIRRESLENFITALEDCDDNDYFERGMQILIDRGEIFKKHDVSRYRCIEIDFEEDWEKAKDLFGKVDE